MSTELATPDGLNAMVASVIKQTVDATLAGLDRHTVPVGKRYLRPAAAGDFIGCHELTLTRFRREKRGPRYSVLGTRILYSVDDLVAFVDQQRVPMGHVD